MILYKYYPCNKNTFISLSLNGLWCSNHSKMNDPFECLAKLDRSFDKKEIDYFKQILLNSKDPNFLKVQTLDDSLLLKFINNLRKKPLDRYAFCSFSEDPNNILMWTHYANNHSGIVIGFEFPELENDTNFQKVEYRNTLKSINLGKYAQFMVGLDDEYLNEIISDYSVKSKHWSYEKEWRIWRNKEGYFKYNPENIKEIHFGLNTSEETKAIILRLLHFLPKNFNVEQKKLNYNPLGLK